MTVAAILREGRTIIKLFNAASVGDPYGWDYPTMSVLYPDESARLLALVAEYKRRAG